MVHSKSPVCLALKPATLPTMVCVTLEQPGADSTKYIGNVSSFCPQVHQSRDASAHRPAPSFPAPAHRGQRNRQAAPSSRGRFAPTAADLSSGQSAYTRQRSAVLKLACESHVSISAVGPRPQERSIVVEWQVSVSSFNHNVSSGHCKTLRWVSASLYEVQKTCCSCHAARKGGNRDSQPSLLGTGVLPSC